MNTFAISIQLNYNLGFDLLSTGEHSSSAADDEYGEGQRKYFQNASACGSNTRHMLEPQPNPVSGIAGHWPVRGSHWSAV